jgi:3-hydroxyacyl-CoA dehydrogenase
MMPHTVRLSQVLMAMENYALGRHGDAWTPAPPLVALAAEGKRFNG